MKAIRRYMKQNYKQQYCSKLGSLPVQSLNQLVTGNKRIVRTEGCGKGGRGSELTVASTTALSQWSFGPQPAPPPVKMLPTCSLLPFDSKSWLVQTYVRSATNFFEQKKSISFDCFLATTAATILIVKPVMPPF